jgi:deoxyuridine 5''-triphosphate nucleotidohydrolase (dut)
MTSLPLRVQRLPHGAGLPLPAYATDGAAGMDLLAACEDHITLLPGKRALIPTGLCIEIPNGYEGQVRARSGLALKQGVGIPNGPGTIDSDYRGEVGVLLINWGDEPQTIRRGDRIAQLVLAPVVRAELIETEQLEGTPRGGGGFGHSGR